MKIKFKKNKFKYISWLISLGVIFSISFIYWLNLTLPDYEQIVSRVVSESTKIYDRTGEILLYEIHDGENRTILSFEEIPEIVKQATIAAEDKNFYTHPAFDWKGIVRSVFINITSNQKVSGSTITQQLAKNAFLSPEKTIIRKLRELLLALKLEKNFTKDEILTLYLNQIPYGGSTYGIEAAAETYFNKKASELTLSEATILAALPQAPTYYSPYGNHKEDLFNRQKYVLNQMVEIGFIDNKEKENTLNSTQNIIFEPQSDLIKAPHFVMMVVDYIRQVYGEEMLRTGGLRVETTLDWDLQQKAEKSIREGVERNTELYKGKNGALVAQEVKTGEIVALVGSVDYFDIENEGNFNVADQGLRQPGSAFKPFAYFQAFRRGYNPATILWDVPTEFSPNCSAVVDFYNKNTNCYHPKNFDDYFRGPVTMREALAQSINVPAVKTLYLAGLDNTITSAEKLGLTTLDDRSRFGLSLVLGGGEITLKELVGAYSVFAQEGEKTEQHIINKIKDNKGRVLEEWNNKKTRVAEALPIQLLNDILTDIEARSGLFHSSLGLTIFSGRQVALKTGTTNDYVDAWTIGYTPSLVVGVWAGNNHREPMQQQGSSLLAALPMWSDFFREAVEQYPVEQFNKPKEEIIEKPILKGDWKFNNQIHSILWFVDKNNPTSDKPNNPGEDPQFNNWEIPVLTWAQNNINNFSDYNKNNEYNYNLGEVAPVLVKIKYPKSGDFITENLEGEVELKSDNNLNKIEIILNGKKIKTEQGSWETIKNYSFTILSQEIQPQNNLEIKAWNEAGGRGSDNIIIYK